MTSTELLGDLLSEEDRAEIAADLQPHESPAPAPEEVEEAPVAAAAPAADSIARERGPVRLFGPAVWAAAWCAAFAAASVTHPVEVMAVAPVVGPLLIGGGFYLAWFR